MARKGNKITIDLGDDAALGQELELIASNLGILVEDAVLKAAGEFADRCSSKSWREKWQNGQ